MSTEVATISLKFASGSGIPDVLRRYAAEGDQPVVESNASLGAERGIDFADSR